MKNMDAKKFSKVMRDLARTPSKVSRAISNDISTEIQHSFDHGVDPYGRSWRQLAKSTLKSGRHPPPLTNTGKGRESVKVLPTAGAGFKVTVGVVYMIYHQFGGKSHLRGHRKNKNFGRDKDRGGSRERPPKRSFLPFDRVPSTWSKIVLDNLEKEAKRRIGGG